MTTSAMTSSMQHTTDAEFRAWAKQVSDMLQAVGLVKTTDTGQIDFNTVLRPGVSTAGGYEIYRFNDALQASRPVFIKVEYGTSGTATIPQMWWTVGAGSNGAGTITTITRTRTIIGRNLTPSTQAAASYASYIPALGYFAFAGWITANTSTAPSGMMAFSVQRPLDDTGAVLDEGLVFYDLQAATFFQSMWSYLTNSALYSNSTVYTVFPGSITSSNFAGDVQLVRHFCSTPRVRNLIGYLTYLDTEITRGGAIQATMFGTPRTYMPLGNAMQALGSLTAHVPAMLFE